MELEEIERYVKQAGSEISPDFVGSVEGGIYAQQAPDEFSQCMKYLMDNGPINSYLEVGVAAGGTVYLVNYFLRPETIVLIDDDKHPSAFRRKEVLKGIKRYEIIGQSSSGKTTAQLEQIMGDKGFDLVLIDAEHSYTNCKRDAMIYKQYINKGGYLLFHDSSQDGYYGYGVGRVVWETKQDDRYEFIAEYESKVSRPLGLALFRKVA
jgi:predicted O-methyltransferase YrrM